MRVVHIMCAQTASHSSFKRFSRGRPVAFMRVHFILDFAHAHWRILLLLMWNGQPRSARRWVMQNKLLAGNNNFNWHPDSNARKSFARVYANYICLCKRFLYYCVPPPAHAVHLWSLCAQDRAAVSAPRSPAALCIRVNGGIALSRRLPLYIMRVLEKLF